MCLSEDSFPFISQLKSLILLLHCDTFGSLQTQITFSKQFIIISQIRSLIQYLFYNDSSAAKQTQIEFYHESILPFPILSQLISIMVLFFFRDTYCSWRIQQKFINKLTNFITIPIRFIYYILNYKATIGRQVSVPNTSPFTSWMGDNFNHIPLNALTLIGTHNAHSYKLRTAVSFIYNITCCQNLSIYRQLISGSRCLDIRLCNFNKQLWCAHSYCNTVKFIDIIQQILRFIKQYPSEIIILRCKTEWVWRNKPNNPVIRDEIINVIHSCHDAKNYCAPFNTFNQDVLNINIGELAQRKWNIIVFHEFEYANYQMITSWHFTQSAFAKQLIGNVKKWIYEKVNVIGNKKMYFMMNEDDDDINMENEEYIININENERKRLYLVNGQITPIFNCKYVLFMIITGIFGLRCDVELVNAEMLRNIHGKELFKLHVWDMDFLHPLLVQKIIDNNLKYCTTK